MSADVLVKGAHRHPVRDEVLPSIVQGGFAELSHDPAINTEVRDVDLVSPVSRKHDSAGLLLPHQEFPAQDVDVAMGDALAKGMPTPLLFQLCAQRCERRSVATTTSLVFTLGRGVWRSQLDYRTARSADPPGKDLGVQRSVMPFPRKPAATIAGRADYSVQQHPLTTGVQLLLKLPVSIPVSVHINVEKGACK